MEKLKMSCKYYNSYKNEMSNLVKRYKNKKTISKKLCKKIIK